MTGTTHSLYRTVVISGGEGYDEYRLTTSSITTSNVGISLSNMSSSTNPAVSGVLGSNSVNNQQQASLDTNISMAASSNAAINMMLAANPLGSSSGGGSGVSSGTNVGNNATSCNTVMTSSSMMLPNFEESHLGKEDLVNYVLSWEI